MIGVICKDNELGVVREFFELFKTPWEFYTPERAYDLLLATCEEIPRDLSSDTLVVFSSRRIKLDDSAEIKIGSSEPGGWLEWGGVGFPVYGEVSVFQPTGCPLLRKRGKSEIAGLRVTHAGGQLVRIGYDLFQEVAFLLSRGQLSENAHIPTLEMHISLLRSILMHAKINFLEIPPVPAGYEYMACLTHDVDFTGIREHKFDFTMWGFIYRGLASSLFNAIIGRATWSKWWKNWKAVFSLPFVHLGWKDDFWLEFDRYMEIEKGLGSTFFFIPFKNYPGMQESDLAPKRRGAKYDLGEIKEQVHKLVEHGCEVGLHGIDAWLDSTRAQAELNRIRKVSDQSEIGVRMHWLYFSEGSHQVLEQAGLSYDSTFGYNDAVGFRAGTSQAFRPIGAEELLELPLIIQDTALFYPGRMHLSETEAMQKCKHIIGSMARFGGALVINWHTRSLSPERLWGDFYHKLLEEMRKHRIWFATAHDAVTWFRRRRGVRFHEVQFTAEGVSLKLSGPSMEALPPLLVRVHCSKFGSTKHSEAHFARHPCVESFWRGERELKIPAPGNETAFDTMERRRSASRCAE